jgi:alpha-tubulin suppressor-like RCC1 family protein
MLNYFPADFFHYLSDYLSFLDIINLSRVTHNLHTFLSKDESFWQSKCNGKKKEDQQTWRKFYIQNYMNVLTFGFNINKQLFGFKFKDIAVSKHIIAIDLHDNVLTFGADIHYYSDMDKEDLTFPRKLNFKSKYVTTKDNHMGFIDMDNNGWVRGTNVYCELGIQNIRDFHIVNNYVRLLPLICDQGHQVKVQQICFGCSYTMLLDTENNIWGSGSNTHGQLGLRDYGPRKQFTQIIGLKGKQICVGSDVQSSHTIVIDLEDNMWVFGDNRYGQLGINNYFRNNPTPMLNGFKVKQVATDYTHTIMIDLEDYVWVCGNNSFGQLGLDTESLQFKPIRHEIKAKQIVAGQEHNMLIDFEDNVWILGCNFYSKLVEYNCTPFKIPNIKALKIATGNNSSAIITKL